MARPTKPKDVKPKAIEGQVAPSGGGGGEPQFDIKFFAAILLISVLSIAGSAASVYLLGPIALEPVIAKMVQTKEGDGGHGKAHAASEAQTLGMNLELDEFTVNLKNDPSMGGNQFLRTKITLGVAVPDAEYCEALIHGPSPEGGGGGHASVSTPKAIETATLPAQRLQAGTLAGAAANIDNTVDNTLIASGGGSPADPYAECQTVFNKNMARFVPTMRDIVNQALMKRTAGMLASVEGQEVLKDEVKTEVNHVMGDKYSIIRVNFSDFIIQY